MALGSRLSALGSRPSAAACRAASREPRAESGLIFPAMSAPKAQAALAKALRDGSFAPVYLFHGDDDFRKEAAVRALVASAVDAGLRDFNVELRRGPDLDAETLGDSREVLRNYGNMSSATVLFVLERIMKRAQSGERGCAMAFGPGLTAETLLFSAA